MRPRSKIAKKYKISFCTSCMNRLHHLKQTYIKNIEDSLPYGNVEFVLLNWNSQDGMHEWVKKNLTGYIKKGIVKYIYTFKPKEFQPARARNITARNASGKIVCWVDADNYAGPYFVYYIHDQFNKNENIILAGYGCKSFWGRIAILKKYFMKIKGHDENMFGWGYEDHDFFFRCKRLFNLKVVWMPLLENKKLCFHRIIYHKMTLANNEALNISISERNLQNKKFIVNNAQWGLLP